MNKSYTIQSICKHCKNPHSFKVPITKLSTMMYCSDNCWKLDWIKNGCGLIHPKYVQIISKFPMNYGGRTNCQKLLRNVEEKILIKNV